MGEIYLLLWDPRGRVWGRGSGPGGREARRRTGVDKGAGAGGSYYDAPYGGGLVVMAGAGAGKHCLAGWVGGWVPHNTCTGRGRHARGGGGSGHTPGPGLRIPHGAWFGQKHVSGGGRGAGVDPLPYTPSRTPPHTGAPPVAYLPFPCTPPPRPL